jgi:Leucine-rich repeat (LRR) protein
LKEKTELMQKLKLLEDKINFIDTLINSYENQTPNFYLNINIKHLLYGENINLDEIVKEFKMKSGELEIEMKQKAFEDLIKNNFIEATKGMDKLFLMDKNLGNSLINDIIKGLENSTIFEILKFGNKILNPKEIISIKDIKFLNLRGNKISNIDFLLNKDFGNLEILSLNNNEIESIDIFKEINFPLLRELYLSKNKISSIDSLIELKSKKLQILWLSENNISSIDCLEKMKFPQLRKLGLNKNKIKDINVLIKMKFPQLLELYINDNEFDLDNFYEIIEKLSLKVREFYY